METAYSIVAVHGLDGHRESTWIAENGILWLETLLPEDVPKARVYTYGYDFRTHSRDEMSRETFYGHAFNLPGALTLERRTTKVFDSLIKANYYARLKSSTPRLKAAESFSSHTALAAFLLKEYHHPLTSIMYAHKL